MIRKIMTQEEKAKKEARNKTIIGIILGIILLFSSVGYAFFSFERDDTKTGKIVYNKIEFSQTDYGFWSFAFGGNNYQTIYNPEQTGNITGSLSNNIQLYYNKPLYFGIDSLASISSSGRAEILRNLQNIILKEQYSCITEDCTEDYPIKKCSEDNVVILKRVEGNISTISENQKCVTINYVLGEEEKAADAFLFKLLGIQ